MPPLPAGKLSALSDAAPGGVYLMAATLRPETMYGQTNCWALPEGQYGAFRGLDGEVYIMTERSALNLSYQVRGRRGRGRCHNHVQPISDHRPCTLHMFIVSFASFLKVCTPAACQFKLSNLHLSTKQSHPPLLTLPTQERTPKRGEPECLLQLSGQDLIGLPLSSPNSDLQIYVLPLLTILTNKGTGIVTSVPSDSPDDYIALQVAGGVGV